MFALTNYYVLSADLKINTFFQKSGSFALAGLLYNFKKINKSIDSNHKTLLKAVFFYHFNKISPLIYWSYRLGR